MTLPEIPRDNFINIKDNELDAPIYRVTSVSRFMQILVTQKLELSRPEVWDDPFENILSRIRCELRDGTLVGFGGVMQAFYGQCWTLCEESDAMWRMYAPGKDGVKMQTTVRKLMGALYDLNDESADRKFFIGQVLYEQDEEILKVFSDMFPDSLMVVATDRTFRLQALTLLVKRMAFGHEKEVRVLYRSPETTGERTKAFHIDPNDTIQKVALDPRMSETECDTWKHLMVKAGYHGLALRSTLYDPPKLILRHT